MATVKLVSAGTGRSIPIGDEATVADIRAIAEVSDDLKLSFNGHEVTNEDEVIVQDGDQVVAYPGSKIGHG